jgi:choline dehydrogenase
MQHKTRPFTSPPTTTAFASLEKIQPHFLNAERHIQGLLAEYAAKHPNADLASQNILLARQLLNPKEAVCQIVALQTGGDLRQVHTPSKVFPSHKPGM